MSILRAGVRADATAGPATQPAQPATVSEGRFRRMRVAGLLAAAGLLAEVAAIEWFLWPLLSRPFYYDEASRAYEIGLGAGFLSRLHLAAAPLALGWLGIENAARILFGDTEAGLRAPMFAALPVLAVATYLLARRWLGVAPSLCVAGLLVVNGWIVNYALQLKSYSYEALFAVVALALYLITQRPGQHWARELGLFVALGLTCVFSLPNLLIVGPLLVLDFVRTVRARDRLAVRLAGEAVAAAIALVHYVLFVRPQSGVTSTIFFDASFAPSGFVAFARFIGAGLASYVPSMVVGIEGGAANAAPVFPLTVPAHVLLVMVLVVLLAAGVAAASRDAAGRALLVAVGGALLLELVGSALRRWPFGLIRVNIFVLPLLYVLAGLGAVWLARRLRWRALAAPATVLAAAALAAIGLATAGTLAQTRRLATEPTWFGAIRAAVAQVRVSGTPADLVIIRADRYPPDWYAYPWLYYMQDYQGYPAAVTGHAPIPPGNTFAVPFVPQDAVDRFLAAHTGSLVVFLVEYLDPGGSFPPWRHWQSVRTLRNEGYCRVREIPLADTGVLTILDQAACKARRLPPLS